MPALHLGLLLLGYTLADLAGLAMATTNTTQATGLAITTRYRSIPAPFNSTSYNWFIDCVVNVSSTVYNTSTSSPYAIAIYDGEVAVVPSGNNSINVDGADSGLVHCLAPVSVSLSVAIYSDQQAENGTATNDTAVQNLDLATARWADANGAQGLQGLAYNTTTDYTNTTHQLLARTPSYYFAYGSDFKDCSSPDSQPAVYNECISHSNSFASIQFGNADPVNGLMVNSWPHHRCAVDYKKKDVKTTWAAPGRDSECVKRATFSYEGYVSACMLC